MLAIDAVLCRRPIVDQKIIACSQLYVHLRICETDQRVNLSARHTHTVLNLRLRPVARMPVKVNRQLNDTMLRPLGLRPACGSEAL